MRAHLPHGTKLDRRQTLALLGSAGVALVIGCGTDKDGGGSGSVSSSSGDSASSSSGDSASSSSGGSIAWATGGTKSMAGDYPDPFKGDLGSSCVLTCAQILGPCYAKTIERKDISEGHDGLPMRLSLRVVDESCKPIAGATVDIWHTAAEGVYSGDDAVDMCTLGDAVARANRWFRGVQTTDANGRVDFDSCFPGWYSGRSIHIHFTIRINGTEYVTSQLYFPDELCDEIVDTQPPYAARGKRDTTNKTDGVISADAVGDYTLETAKMSDGALQAWKVLVIRSSLDSALCNAPAGMLGDGGPPPGFDGGPPPGFDGGL